MLPSIPISPPLDLEKRIHKSFLRPSLEHSHRQPLWVAPLLASTSPCRPTDSHVRDNRARHMVRVTETKKNQLAMVQGAAERKQSIGQYRVTKSKVPAHTVISYQSVVLSSFDALMVVFICNRWGVDTSRHSPNLWLDSKRSCTCSTCHGMLVVVGTTQFELVAVRTFLSVTCCLSEALILYNKTKRPCRPVASRCLSLLFHTCQSSESYYVVSTSDHLAGTQVFVCIGVCIVLPTMPSK